MTERSRVAWEKWLPILLALIGSAVSSYAAVKISLANLETRVGIVERRVETKLDMKHHDELVDRLEAMQRQNDDAHQQIMNMLVTINRSR